MIACLIFKSIVCNVLSIFVLHLFKNRIIFDSFYILGAPHLTDGMRQVSTAYQEIGTIFEQEPKHDWEPLSNLLYEYKGVIDAFPAIINAAKVKKVGLLNESHPRAFQTITLSFFIAF